MRAARRARREATLPGAANRSSRACPPLKRERAASHLRVFEQDRQDSESTKPQRATPTQIPRRPPLYDFVRVSLSASAVPSPLVTRFTGASKRLGRSEKNGRDAAITKSQERNPTPKLPRFPPLTPSSKSHSAPLRFSLPLVPGVSASGPTVQVRGDSRPTALRRARLASGPSRYSLCTWRDRTAART